VIDTSDFRNGLSIIQDGQVFQIVSFQHVKPGKGPAFVRTKLRNLITGANIDKTFRAGEKMEQAIINKRPASFLYHRDDEYTFMDLEDYDQITVPKAAIGPQAIFLKDNTEVQLITHDGDVLSVEVPMHMEFTVTQTDPGLRGDTASGGAKPATLETGAVVNVPLFIEEGEQIRVDTRTGVYLERAKS